jgi:hypothetical protein
MDYDLPNVVPAGRRTPGDLLGGEAAERTA